MKNLVAMELAVVRQLAAEARAAGLDPARDPIPGLRRDVLFTCTADEEAGGQAAARAGSSRTAPEWLRGGGRHQRVRRRVHDGRRRAVLPDPGRGEGLSPPTGSTSSGTWGHGSMPREDNAVVLAAAVDRAPGRTGPDPAHARHDPVPRGMRRRRSAGAAGTGRCGAIAAGDDALSARPPSTACATDVRPVALRALLRDTHQPGRRPRRRQVQRHPGRRRRSKSTAASCPVRPRR